MPSGRFKGEQLYCFEVRKIGGVGEAGGRSIDAGLSNGGISSLSESSYNDSEDDDIEEDDKHLEIGGKYSLQLLPANSRQPQPGFKLTYSRHLDTTYHSIYVILTFMRQLAANLGFAFPLKHLN